MFPSVNGIIHKNDGRTRPAPRLAWILVVIPPLLGSQPVSGVAHAVDGRGSSLEARVLAEYPKALAEMESLYAQARGRGKYTQDTYWGASREHRVRRYSLDFAFDHERKMLHRALLPFDRWPTPTIVEQVWSTNDDYTFHLERTNDSPLSIFYRGSDSSWIERDLNLLCKKFVNAPFTILDLPISKIVSHQSFRIKKVEKVVDKDRDMLKITFDYLAPKVVFGPGWLLVSPADNWATVEYEWQRTGVKGPDVPLRGRVEYAGEHKGFPIPKTVIITPSPTTQDTFEFEELVFDSTPSEAFRLSKFGLPEIDLKARNRYSGQSSVWLFALAALALALSIVFKIYSRRLART
jgi:hypothetical protein